MLFSRLALYLQCRQTRFTMANFDPKTTIARFLFRYPTLKPLFEKAAGNVDENLTIEEFCFTNGIDIVSFFQELDTAIANLRAHDEAFEQRIADDRESIKEKIPTPSANPATEEENKTMRQHNMFVTGLLCFGLLLFAASAIANCFFNLTWLRSILGIKSALYLPHIAQILGVLNLAGAAGCILLLLRKKIGIIVMFAGTMLNDILVVTLTDGIPFATIFAVAVCACLLALKFDGKPYADYLK